MHQKDHFLVYYHSTDIQMTNFSSWFVMFAILEIGNSFTAYHFDIKSPVIEMFKDGNNIASTIIDELFT